MTSDAPSSLKPTRFNWVSLWTLLFGIVAAALCISIVIAVIEPTFLKGEFTDNDDMLRLKQVKDLLGWAGSDPKSWYALNEPRIAPSVGLDIHWSRLLDGALALVALGFRLFVDEERALWLMQAVWPVMQILPCLWLAYACGKQLHDRESGLYALAYLALAGVPAFTDFRPGRIDHHSVQTLLAFACFYACLRLDGSRNRAVIVGLLMALALAIGYESLPLLLLICLAIAGRHIQHGHPQEWPAFVISFACGTLALYLIQTAPDLWLVPACDALGFNMVLMLISGGGMSLGLIAFHKPQSPDERFRLLILPAIFGLMMGLAYDTECLHGPFGFYGKELWDLWLKFVKELQPAPPRFGEDALFPLAFGPVLGGMISLWLMRRAYPSSPLFLPLTSLLTSGALGVMMIRDIVYPSFYAAPLIGTAFALFRQTLPRPLIFFAGSLAALSVIPIPTALIGGLTVEAVPFLKKLQGPVPVKPPDYAHDKCDQSGIFAHLQMMQKGLVATPMNLAIPVLVNTHHSVTAAPYHRIPLAILASIRAFDSDREAFLDYLDMTGSRYVVLCASTEPEKMKGASITAQLLRREKIDRLQEVRQVPHLVKGQATAQDDPRPLIIWEVKPASQ